MNVREIHAKTILSTSKIYSYVINPYLGCQHGCYYCYARFMKRYSGHQEAWGNFVDVKINAAELLQKEIRKKKRAEVWICSVCDPYQPLEAHYQLTRKCLHILLDHHWPVIIQTRSSLVLRDIEIFKKAKDWKVGLTITTADDEIRRLFEPNAPTIDERLHTLAELHHYGIQTYAMIAPILPGAEILVPALAGKVNYIIIDRMNYHYADWIYRKYKMLDKLSDDFFQEAVYQLVRDCKKLGIECPG